MGPPWEIASQQASHPSSHIYSQQDNKPENYVYSQPASQPASQSDVWRASQGARLEFQDASYGIEGHAGFYNNGHKGT